MTAPQLPANTNVAGKYTVLTCLGAGGSSATYHAVASDGREVALKIFDPAIRQRADIMAALEQTYAATNALAADIVVPLLDAGYDPTTGAPFSVTERIPFPSLAQIGVQRPLTPEELGSVLGFIARALDAAHARQLCHHALKPTNIFVGFAQGYGVRLTDFGAGLARAAVPTQEGYILAAPWLAPEQVQGTVPAGPAADVFAAALVTFWALTGRSYWRSCQSMPDLASWQQELMGPRLPASARARELGVPLSPSFDPVIGAAIALDPGQRYRSIGEFASALDSLIASKGPESPATLAFPSNLPVLNTGGDYPPPPPPMGGMPGGGMPAGYPGGGYPGQGQGSAFDGGRGPATGGAGPGPGNLGAQGQPALPTENTKKPTLELSGARRPASNKLAPILVGLVGFVLVGGSIAAWLLLGQKSPTPGGDGATGTASASTRGTSEVPPASAEPSVAPSAAPSTAPEVPPSAEPSADADAGAAPAPTELILTCEPECEEIKVDGKVAEDPGKPIPVAPGKHIVIGSKSGYAPAQESVIAVAGKSTEKQLKLIAKPAAPIGGPGPGPGPGPSVSNKPKCGKFIKTNCVK